MPDNGCPLCGTDKTEFFYEDDLRTYYKCLNCYLVFVPPHQHLTPEEEKQRYDLHENHPEDEQYRQFLRRLFDPVEKRIPPKSSGLDFGAGPGPTLHLMFEEAGHKMSIYDIFYADDPTVFDRQYDFITASEVVEHLHHPGKELDRLWNCLKPSGILGIMTKLAPNKPTFEDWHYKRDETHVAFYSKPTFRWIANQWRAELSFEDENVIIFWKAG
jgi:hypothetical protein